MYLLFIIYYLNVVLLVKSCGGGGNADRRSIEPEIKLMLLYIKVMLLYIKALPGCATTTPETYVKLEYLKSC